VDPISETFAMSRSHVVPIFHTVALGVVMAFGMSGPAAAQSLDPNSWIPNGDVNAVAAFDNTIYVGGAFTEWAPPTGAVASFDPGTAALQPGFPKVVGQIYAICGDGAGGVYLGGQFTKVGDQARTNLAHVNASNVVTAWDPVPNNYVLALYRNPTTGTVYAGGLFSTIDGVSRNRFGEIDSNGNVTSYAPSISSTVTCIEMYNGFIIVGGQFANAGGQPRSRIASLNPTTGLADAWNPSANGTVNALKVVTHASVTSLIVGGSFTTIGGQTRNGAANISLTTGLASAWNPNIAGTVFAIADYPTGFVLGGSFTSVSGQPCTNICQVNDTNGSPGATAWAPFLDQPVFALLPHGPSEVMAAGRFSVAGGQTRRGLAVLQLANPGNGTAWNAKLNEDVLALHDRGTSIVAGGEFTSANAVERLRLAAFDRSSGALLPWNPMANNVVNALALRTNGSTLQSIFVGGAFDVLNNVKPRLRLAELDPTTGTATTWNPGAGSDPVYALKISGNLLYVGGAFTGIGGVYRPGLAAVDMTTGQTQVPFAPMIFGGPVYSIELGPGVVYAGGSFTGVNDTNIPRPGLAQFLASNGAVTAWNPVPAPAVVRALSMSADGSSLAIGGDFTTINGNGRLRIAALGTSIPAVLQSWNPSTDAPVRCLSRKANVIYAGGDFLNVNLSTQRLHLAGLDATSGTATPFNVSLSTGNVFAHAIDGPEHLVGGSFTAVGGAVQQRFARYDDGSAPTCAASVWASEVGAPTRYITSGDVDADGLTDLLICGSGPSATVMRGQGAGGMGNGLFVSYTGFGLTAPAKCATFADFNADGLNDVAITMSSTSGLVWVFRNLGVGGWAAPIEIPVMGACDGLAAGDLDQDGILDLVVCLTDSAGVANRGGVQFLKGGGTNGTWNGTFATVWKLPSTANAVARRVTLQDLNDDGTLDILYSGQAPGSVNTIRMTPGGVPGVHDGIGGLVLPVSATDFAVGDLNGDGRADLVGASGRIQASRLRTATNNTNDPFNQWWASVLFQYVVLPSTPRELELLDYDLDGRLDLACTMDSIGRVEIHRGRGDGSFEQDEMASAALEAWGLVVGDFASNGSTDLVVGQPTCGTVRTIPQPLAPVLPMGLTVVSPNGGEMWAPLPPSTGGGAATEALGGSGPGAPPSTDAAQTITWTKGAGVLSVDIELSRNGGTTWQTIARNQPGTTLTWIVTPPASNQGRVRVRDAAVASHADASDGTFIVAGGVVGVDPLDGLPRVAAIRLAGANPVVRGVGGALAFRLDVPRAADVRVDVFDAAGRHVHTLARGRYAPGTHQLAWDGGARPGVYFARALVGEAKAVSKFVVLQ
jgi:hypothetical protein